MKTFFHLFGILCFILSLASCSDNEGPDVSGIQVDFKIRRLDQELRECKTEAEVLKMLNKDPKFSEFYFNRSQYPHDSVLVNTILEFTNYVYTDTLFLDAERVYGDFTALENQFREAFKHLKYYYPLFETPDIYLSVSGFGSRGWGNDVMMDKNYIVIGLDYFGGETATYKPPANQVPDYILRRLDKEHLVTSVMLKMSDFFNQIDPPLDQRTKARDNSLLADMIFFGKAYTFVKHMVPSADDSLIIGYSGKELATAHHNQVDIYSHFIENKLFYESTDFIKNKYIMEAPRVVDIADECPGRIGQWLGWQVVKHYMYENEGVSLQDVMANWKAQDIFQQSKYKPLKPSS